MSARAWVWLQVLGGWLPVWALYTALIATMHRAPFREAALFGLRAVLPAALLGVGVHALVRRAPWPRPFRLSFALLHVAAAPLYAIAWVVSASLVESLLAWRIVILGGPVLLPFLVLGVWLYAMVAGISYAIQATERAARAEAAAARTQLATLRAQLHPHFLFNALHTVVQLIPAQPERAQHAAELVAGLLRTTVEEDRDLVSLGSEWAFVSRYLEMERIRFGDRLRVRAEIDEALLGASIPSFALQTLVENAVRHGAAPRVAPTEIHVTATASPAELTLRVHDTGDGAADGVARDAANGVSSGTGLARLRERLAVLYGGAARLVLDPGPAGGFSATLVLPRREAALEGEG